MYIKQYKSFGGSGSAKTNALLNLNIDKIRLYATDPYEPKY